MKNEFACVIFHRAIILHYYLIWCLKSCSYATALCIVACLSWSSGSSHPSSLLRLHSTCCRMSLFILRKHISFFLWDHHLFSTIIIRVQSLCACSWRDYVLSLALYVYSMSVFCMYFCKLTKYKQINVKVHLWICYLNGKCYNNHYKVKQNFIFYFATL